MKFSAIPVFGLMAALLAPQVAYAQSGCTAYDEQAKTIRPTLDKAVALMNAGKVPEGIALLPQLEALLAQVPAAMPAPQLCGQTVVVFDSHQFAEIEALSAAGEPVPGYPPDADFEFKDIPFVELAYVTGWLTYENGDFPKALTFYQKGLAVAPNDHNLVNEVLATMIKTKDGDGLVAFADAFLDTDKDADAETRSNATLAKAIGQTFQNDGDAARASVEEALELWPKNENASILKAQLSGP